MLSPVSIASSSVERPSITRPSTGIFSPGFTRRTSPTATSSIATSCSRPSRITRAVFTPRSSNFSIAALA
jgi:hypothetical protein